MINALIISIIASTAMHNARYEQLQQKYPNTEIKVVVSKAISTTEGIVISNTDKGAYISYAKREWNMTSLNVHKGDIITDYIVVIDAENDEYIRYDYTALTNNNCGKLKGIEWRKK